MLSTHRQLPVVLVVPPRKTVRVVDEQLLVEHFQSCTDGQVVQPDVVIFLVGAVHGASHFRLQAAGQPLLLAEEREAVAPGVQRVLLTDLDLGVVLIF